MIIFVLIKPVENYMPTLSNLIHKPNRFPHIPKVAGVYLVIDSNSGKCYVGSTNNMNLRIGNYFGKSKKVNKSLSHLNYENCTFEVLEDCRYLSIDQRLQLELEWIQKLNTIWPNGFNKKCPVTNIEFRNFGIERCIHNKRVKIRKKRKRTTRYGKPAKTNVNVIRNY